MIQMEMIDIIDDKNNVIYKISKEEAHVKGLLHRTTIANILDEKGRFILVKQAGHKQDAGQYVSPIGGHARSGETEDDALKREAFEETGLTDFKYNLKGRFIFNRFILNRQENHLFVVYEIYGNYKIRLNEEAVSYRSFTKDEIKSILSTNKKEFGGAFLAVVENIYPELMHNGMQHI